MKLHEQLNSKLLIDNSSSTELHPVIELMLNRLKNGSKRGARTDGRVVALAIEGGGFRGAISGGMCVALEAAGLIDTVDIIYGTSSGSLNGAFTAAGQAALGSTNYEDSANRKFYNPFRVIGKRGVIDFDFLLDQIIRNRKPLDEQRFKDGPEFRAIAVNPKKQTVEVLMNFTDIDEIMQAIRVSCALPYVTGPPSKFRGIRLLDGGLLAPIPYKPALELGATDVLVLRSRPAIFRKRNKTPEVAKKVINRKQLKVVSLMSESYRIYNEQAEELQKLSKEKGNVFQITPSENMINLQTREQSIDRIRSAMVAGAKSAAIAFNMPGIDLVWHPVPYAIK
jgi:predicted patatin/cPLA2 family phospholipase